MLSVALSGFVYYLDPSNPTKPRRVLKVFLFVYTIPEALMIDLTLRMKPRRLMFSFIELQSLFRAIISP